MQGLSTDQLEDMMGTLSENITVSSGMPTMISSISSSEMSWNDAFVYCADLEEGGYTDWYFPSFEQLVYASFT